VFDQLPLDFAILFTLAEGYFIQACCTLAGLHVA